MTIESIVVLSDVSLGYGSPQVLSLSRSLRDFFNASLLILEPDQPERPYRPERFADLGVERLYTASHPHSPAGQIDFNLQAAARVRSIRPDMLVVCAFLGAPVLLSVRRPKLVVYYGYEHTDGGFLREQRTFKALSDRIDVAAFCEENRAYLDAPRLGLESKPTAIVYNGASTTLEPLSMHARNGRIVSAGQIDPERTLGKHLFEGGLDGFDIDVFGTFQAVESPTTWIANLVTRGSRVSYRGYLPYGRDFLEVIRQYSYSLVAWSPQSESTRFAAPNKFFDAIAAGVPPLAAPHPLCQRIIERYGCGVLLDGWTLEDFQRGCARAMELFGTDDYEKMISSGIPRAASELSWESQFKKLAVLLEKYRSEPGRLRANFAGSES